MSTRYIGGLVYNPPGGWSCLFNGSNQYLQAPDNVAFQLGTGDFTIEAWINMATLPASNAYYIIAGKYSSSANCMFFDVNNNAGTLQLLIGGAASTVTGNFAFSANVWYHVAAVRNGATTTLYVNGASVGSGTFSDNVVVSGITYRIGVIQSTASSTFLGYFNGYISNHRLVKGTAVYTANFTPPTGALQPITNTSILTCRYPTIVDGSTNAFTITNVNTVTVNTANPFPTSVLPNPALGNAGNGIYTLSQYASLLGAGTWPAYDPYYENVTLNLHGNAGAVLPFNTDASTNNFQVTQVGDTRPSNLTPFITNGYWSNYFDGSGDYLTAPSSSVFDFDSGAFTIEMWVFPLSHPSETLPISRVYDGAGNYSFAAYFTAGVVKFLYNGLTTISTSTTLALSSWSHIAYVRSGTTLTIYVNGVSAGSGTISGSITASSYAVGVGARYNNAFPFNGYISNVRLVKGTAVYTSAFTPPTAPLTTISGTSLLTCQSNRFIDNSTNAFTITVAGNTAVDPLQPFTAPTGTSAYGSGFFDGSGDTLSAPTNAVFSLASSAFTIEAWVYFSSVSGDRAIISDYGSASTGWTLQSVSGIIKFYTAGNTVGITGTSTMVVGTWYHIAVSGTAGTSMKLFINGVQEGSTSTSNITDSSTAVTTGSGASTNYFSGYISNVRVVKGTAVYTTNFTPPTTPLTAISGTSLLTVQTNAPSQNNTFLDSSTNNFVITRNGNTTQGTFTPYGSNWSNYFDGSSNLALSSAPVSATGAFTVECWVYITGTTTYQSVYSQYLGADAGRWIILWDNTASKFTFDIGASTSYASTNTYTANKWHHIAWVRDGSNNLSFYINGVRDSTNASVTTSLSTSNPTIANRGGGATPYTGYISNLRITNTAVYSGTTYTVPTAPLTNISGTTLLTCQSNRFVDNETTPLTFTISGSPSVQRFSPFIPTSAYSTSVIGGSGYFDGTGDYLTTNYTINWSTYGSYTLEFWVYHTTMSPTNQMYFAGGTGGTGNTIFYNYANGRIGLGINGTNEIVSSSGVIKANTWQHIAYTFNGTTTILYVDGVQVASGTTAVYANSSVALAVGGGSASSSFVMNGYIANMRLSQSVIYSSAFTPPTSPVTGGALLLNYTNAGILDNAMMTDWETLGSAQLNTAYKKYGSGSISMLATGDYCRSTQPSTVGDINRGDFTIEFWVYFTSVAANRALISKYGNTAENTGGLGYVVQFQQSIPSLRFVLNNGAGSDIVYDFAWSPAISTWYHIAITRSGTSGRAFINGNQIGSTTTFTTSDAASPNATQIGKTHTAAQYLLGYMDDVRVTKGVARYTTTFTPPTSQVQDQ